MVCLIDYNAASFEDRERRARAPDQCHTMHKSPDPTNSATRGYSLTVLSVPLLPRPLIRRTQKDLCELGFACLRRRRAPGTFQFVLSGPQCVAPCRTGLRFLPAPLRRVP